MTGTIHKLSGGEISLWAEPKSSVMLKINSKRPDPVELGEGEVEELIQVLQTLLKEIS
jgi:hypothetical protein